MEFQCETQLIKTYLFCKNACRSRKNGIQKKYAITHFLVLLIVGLQVLGAVLNKIFSCGLGGDGGLEILDGVALFIFGLGLVVVAGVDFGVVEVDGSGLLGDVLGETHDALEHPVFGVVGGGLVEAAVLGGDLVQDHLEGVEAANFKLELGELLEDGLLGLLAGELRGLWLRGRGFLLDDGFRSGSLLHRSFDGGFDGGLEDAFGGGHRHGVELGERGGLFAFQRGLIVHHS